MALVGVADKAMTCMMAHGRPCMRDARVEQASWGLRDPECQDTVSESINIIAEENAAHSCVTYIL